MSQSKWFTNKTVSNSLVVWLYKAFHILSEPPVIFINFFGYVWFEINQAYNYDVTSIIFSLFTGLVVHLATSSRNIFTKSFAVINYIIMCKC